MKLFRFIDPFKLAKKPIRRAAGVRRLTKQRDAGAKQPAG